MKIKILLPAVLLLSSAHVDALDDIEMRQSVITIDGDKYHYFDTRPTTNLVFESLEMSDLYKLARGGDVDALKPHVNIKDIYGLTLLHYAAWRGEAGVVEHLLSLGANPDVLGRYGSPLLIAVRWAHPDIVPILLRYRANPNSDVEGGVPQHYDEYPNDALAMATYKGWDVAVDALLAYGAKLPTLRMRGCTFIQHLLNEGYVLTLKAYFKHRDKYPELTPMFSERNSTGESPLMAIINHTDFFGMRIMKCICAVGGRYAVDRKLIQENGTPQIDSYSNDHHGVLEFFLKMGAPLTETVTKDYFDVHTRERRPFSITLIEKLLCFYQDALTKYRNSLGLELFNQEPQLFKNVVKNSYLQFVEFQCLEIHEREQHRKKGFKLFNHTWGLIGALLVRDHSAELSRINWSMEPTADASYPAILHRAIWHSKAIGNVMPRILDGIEHPDKYLTAEIVESAAELAGVTLADEDIHDLDPPYAVRPSVEEREEILTAFETPNTGLDLASVTEKFTTISYGDSEESWGHVIPPLENAIQQGNEEAVKILLNSREYSLSDLGYALTIAAKYGHLRIAEVLHQLGAGINYRDNLRFATPLHRAARHNKPFMCQWLLEHGADPMVLEYQGSTPLEYAIRYSCTHAVKALLEGGVPLSGVLYTTRYASETVDYGKEIINSAQGKADIIALLLTHGFRAEDFAS